MLDAHLQSPSGPETQAMLKDIPSYMHIMRHVYRSANYTKPGQVKNLSTLPNPILLKLLPEMGLKLTIF